VNSSTVALRFLFTVTLGRANLAAQLTRVHYPRGLPRVLSPEEVARLLEAAPGTSERGMIAAAMKLNKPVKKL
jgi:integrase/recombinase XerD